MTSSLREWRRASQHYFRWRVQLLRGRTQRGDILVKTQWKANIESSHRMARCCCEGERNLETYSRKTSVESSCRMARSEWIGKMTYDRHAPNLIPRQSGHLQLSLLEADGKRSGLTSYSWESNPETEGPTATRQEAHHNRNVSVTYRLHKRLPLRNPSLPSLPVRSPLSCQASSTRAGKYSPDNRLPCTRASALREAGSYP